MAVFTYKASDAAGAGDQSGTITADTPRQARDLLRARGLTVRDLDDFAPRAAPASGSRADAAPISPLRRRRRARGQRYLVTQLLRELSTLLSVGVPLVEALDTISRQHAGRFRGTILVLRDRVTAGASLAQAMSEQPHAFDDLAVSITEVGEDAGTLDTSLERLAEFRERAELLRGRISTALIYPAIVSVLAVGSSVFLMTFVVPRILEPLMELGHPMPLATLIVKGLSDALLAWGWLLAIALAAAACGFAILVRTERGKLAWDRFILRLPVIGDLVRKQAIVRIAVVVGTLLKSGIVFVRALQIAQRTTSNVVIRDALARCEVAIAAGSDIGEALEKTKAFPPMVVQIFSVGQESGRLEEMLDRLAAVYDQQVQHAAQRLAAILEPALIVLLAVGVLFVVMATVLPILEAGNAIQ